MTLTVTFKLGTDPDKAQQLVQNRVAQAEPRLPEEVRAPRRHDGQELARPHHGGAPALAERPLRHDLSAQLRAAERQGPAGAHRRRRPGAAVRRRRLLDARLARSAEGRRARPVRERRRARDPRAERAGRGRRRRRLAGRAGTSTSSSRSTRRAACRARRSSATSSSRPGANGAVTRLRDVARIELGASEYALRSLLDNKPAVAIADLPGAGLERASRSPTTSARPWPS